MYVLFSHLLLENREREGEREEGRDGGEITHTYKHIHTHTHYTQLLALNVAYFLGFLSYDCWREVVGVGYLGGFLGNYCGQFGNR